MLIFPQVYTGKNSTTETSNSRTAMTKRTRWHERKAPDKWKKQRRVSVQHESNHVFQPCAYTAQENAPKAAGQGCFAAVTTCCSFGRSQVLKKGFDRLLTCAHGELLYRLQTRARGSAEPGCARCWVPAAHVPVRRPKPAFSPREGGPPSSGTLGAGGEEVPPAGTEVDAVTEGGGSPRASGCPGFPVSRGKAGRAGGRGWGRGGEAWRARGGGGTRRREGGRGEGREGGGRREEGQKQENGQPVKFTRVPGS